MAGRGNLYTRQPHTTETHGGEEGRSTTPISCCCYVRTSSPNSKKKKHTCKKELDTLPSLKHNKHSIPTT